MWNGAATGSQNVLVTGGAGYIGSHACKALAQAGYNPVTLDNLSTGHRHAVRWGPMFEVDLRNTSAVERILREQRIEAVIHFAAHAYVGESMSEPAKYFRNNVANTLGLLEAMQSAGVDRIVFSSTCATYGVPESVPIDEDQRQCPVNPYGESKLFVERALGWLGAANGLRWMSLRYFNAAGADPDGEIGEEHDPETHLIPLTIQTALGQRESLAIFGDDYPTEDGTAVRDYIHVSDLADAHVRALRHLNTGGESLAMNLGTGVGHSVCQVIDMVQQVGGRRVDARVAARRDGDPPVLVAASGKAQQVLDWRPRHSSLETIVQTAWHWHSRCASSEQARSAIAA